jgi:hypothetical protein
MAATVALAFTLNARRLGYRTYAPAKTSVTAPSSPTTAAASSIAPDGWSPENTGRVRPDATSGEHGREPSAQVVDPTVLLVERAPRQLVDA